MLWFRPKLFTLLLLARRDCLALKDFVTTLYKIKTNYPAESARMSSFPERLKLTNMIRQNYVPWYLLFMSSYSLISCFA